MHIYEMQMEAKKHGFGLYEIRQIESMRSDLARYGSTSDHLRSELRKAQDRIERVEQVMFMLRGAKNYEVADMIRNALNPV